MHKKPVHIAILSAFFDPFMSGAEMCVDQIVNRLGRKDSHAFTIITARISRHLPQIENRGRYTIIRVGIGLPIDKWLYPFFVTRWIKMIRPDVAHAVMESYAGIALWFTKVRFPNLRTVLTLQSGDLDAKASQRKIPMWLWKKIHTAPDCITSISHFLMTRARLLGARRVSIIPNGVSIGKLDYIYNSMKHERAELLEEKRIVCVARLSEEKGVQDLIKIFAQIKKQIARAKLHLIGDGPLRAHIEQLISEYNLNDSVVMHGKLPHQKAMQILSTAQVAVLPSHGEGLGIAALEAFGVRVPIVASNVGGIPDVVIHEKTGLLCAPENINEFTNAILRLLMDEDLANKIREQAYEYVQNYDWNAISKQYRDVYWNLLKPRVLITTGIYPPDSGGPSSYVYSLTKEMESRGIEAHVITYADESQMNEFLPGVTKISRRNCVFMRYIKYFRQVLRKLPHYDMVFTQDSFSAGIPTFFATELVNRPLILKVVGDPAWERARARGITNDILDDFQLKKYDRKTELVRYLSRVVARKSDIVITPSNYLCGIVKKWGVQSEKIRLIYNSVLFPESSVKISEWPEGSVILYVGRLVEWKGLDNVISILPVLKREISDAKFVIIGDGDYKNELQKIARENNVENDVVFLGRKTRAEVRWAMENSRIFVLYSAYEGLPHVLIEAQSVELPIIASNAGGNCEVVEHKASGFLVPLGDNLMLLKLIRIALTEKDVMKAMAMKAKQEIIRFSREEMMKKTFDLVNKIYEDTDV